jgi:hypothetical protein
MSSKYAKIGQAIKIVNPMRFDRVGYALTYKILRETEREEIKRLVDAAEVAMGLKPPIPAAIIPEKIATVTDPLGWAGVSSVVRESSNYRASQYLEQAACAVLMVTKGFGGKNERKVYETEDRVLLEVTDWVLESKRMIQSGVRYPAWSGYDYYSGEPDYEPAGLAEVQHHCIYTLWGTSPFCSSVMILASHCDWEGKKHDI